MSAVWCSNWIDLTFYIWVIMQIAFFLGSSVSKHMSIALKWILLMCAFELSVGIIEKLRHKGIQVFRDDHLHTWHDWHLECRWIEIGQ